jgi:site-specific DNA recombinase
MKDQAIALCRVSTYRQSIEGTSLEAQEGRIYEAAIAINAEIVKLWSHSISSRKGKNVHRKDLEEMLVYAKQNKNVKYCIVDEPDRFMRDFDVYYYWKVKFRVEANTRLVYAKKPHLAFEDSPMSLMEEMIDVFRAETSNQERIAKTTANMQRRVQEGYYPGKTKPGYTRTDISGLHAPHEPEWSLLQGAFRAVLSGVSIRDAVARLNDEGFRTKNGNIMDTFNFKKLLKDPYYAGIISMSNWTANPNGLHKKMITQEQHTSLLSIVNGTPIKLREKFNSAFALSNIIECTECLNDDKVKHPRLVGFVHNNGKPGNRRKYYSRYKCRGCGALILRDVLHQEISEKILSVRLDDEMKGELMSALRVVWQEEEVGSVRHVNVLRQRLTRLSNEKNNIIRASIKGEISKEDIQPVLEAIKQDIALLEVEIESSQDFEKDFIEFVDFTLNTISNIQEKFWDMDADHQRWCKQLLFPEGFSVSRSGEVYTPVLSEFYRLIANQKDPAGSSEFDLVGDRGVEPLTSTTSMWRSSQLS